MYRFIALVNDAGKRTTESQTAIAIELREAGLQHRRTVGSINLYASQATPVLDVSGGGIVIGHLFNRNFTPIDGVVSVPKDLSPAQVRKYLLEHYWGEYLLVQASTDDSQTAIVMRDPSGGMPCIYSLAHGAGFLTSDISLATRLQLYRKRVDWDAIAHGLTYTYLKTQRTGLADVAELLPGCSLKWTPMGTSIEQEWSPWDFVAADRRQVSLGAAASSIRSTVTAVVRALAEVDESVLVELSGGLDSSIVAASLCGARAQVSCCTLTTPVPGADERQYAYPMAAYLGANLRVRELGFDDARFDYELPADTVGPRLGSLQYATYSAMSAEGAARGVASSFSGGGGDTVFCYLTSAAPAADAFKERGVAAGVHSINDVSTLHQCTFWHAGRLALKKLARSRNAYCEKEQLLLNHSWVADEAEQHPWFDAPPDAYPGDRERIFDLSGTQAFKDGAPRGPDRHMRMPLLSQPVVEACLRVPTWMWVAGGVNRAVARAAFADVLPPEVLNRRSKGTFMSYSGAFYRRNKRRMRDFLLSGHLRQRQIIDADALDRFIERDLPPRDRSFMRVLELCSAENWLRHQV